MSERIIVTGSAGFIGFHLCHRLLNDGYTVIGIDNINNYYDPKLKEARLSILKKSSDFKFYQTDLANKEDLLSLFSNEKISEEDRIVNLAAQAGVRYSLQNPDSYINSNLIGFFNLIGLAKDVHCRHMIYASSSSVYGGNMTLPFSTRDSVDHPISLYAATKKSNELLAHVYSYTYGLPTTGLRFFTVYGPWGRPDMALFLFTQAILNDKPITVYNHGDMSRDFTYIDDIIEGIVGLIHHEPEPDLNWDGYNPTPGSSWVPFRVYNIGNHKPVELLKFIQIIEETLGKNAIYNMQPIQKGDVKATYADIDDLAQAVGFSPKTSVEVGIPKFIEWYLDYYNITL
ncbi:NAD-dependent epimerase [Calditrichota bacterium]